MAILLIYVILCHFVRDLINSTVQFQAALLHLGINNLLPQITSVTVTDGNPFQTLFLKFNAALLASHERIFFVCFANFGFLSYV